MTDDLTARMAGFDPATAATEHDDLPGLLAQARQRCPVVRAQSHQQPYVLVLSDRHARTVGGDHERFSARSGLGASNAAGIGSEAEPNSAPLFGQDPHPSGDPTVDHTELRRRLQPLFTPRAARGWRAYAATLARMRIAELAPRGQCEAVREFAHWIPAYITGGLLGVERRDRPRYRTLVRAFFASEADEQDRDELRRLLRELIKLRRQRPGHDALSVVLHTGATDEQLLEFALLFSAAGSLTSGDTLSTLLWWLADDAGLQQRMRTQPELLPALVDEAARLRGAVATSGRTVTQDTRLGDLDLQRGEQLLVCWYAAGADPARHPTDPASIRFDRRARAHSGWGAGAHRCLGQHVAAVTVSAILEQALTVLPEFGLDPDQATPRPTFGQLAGVDQLPLTWEPTQP